MGMMATFTLPNLRRIGTRIHTLKHTKAQHHIMDTFEPHDSRVGPYGAEWATSRIWGHGLEDVKQTEAHP